MRREEISEEFQWRLEDLYADETLWEEEFAALVQGIDTIKNYEGRLFEADQLLAMQELSDYLNQLMERVYVYASQRLHQDTANARYQGMAGRAQSLMVQLSEATSYVEPELMEIPEDEFWTMLEKNQALTKYKTYFKRLFRQKSHILSREQEELLAGASEVAEGAKDVFMMFNNADLKFPAITGEDGMPVEVTHGRYIGLLESRNRQVRRDAFLGLYGMYERYKNTLSAAFRANVKQATFFARARRYPSSLAAALDGSHIPTSVYDSLIESVHANLPGLHEYVSVRKEKLGVEELHMYDLYVPMVSEVDMKIPFEEAKKVVLEGLAPLGEEYGRLLREGFDSRWIDVYENEGKRSGAYSWGAYGTHPYVLLNYQDNLNNVFTLAHEMGHALHSYYSDATQDYIYAGYKIFVAEVASTCNEALLIHHLLEKTKDQKERAYLLNYFLEQFRATLFRQTMFAEFEKITHAKAEAGETLTAEMLCSIYYDLNRLYFGEELVIDEEIAMEWARIPHFYTPFYVYQYATGFSAAIAISQKILRGEPGIVEQYQKFLSSGSSMECIDLLKLCGVDMTQKEPVERALQVFAECLDEFRREAIKF